MPPPPASTCQSPSSNMYSTCRALQSLLASNLPTLSPAPKIIRAPPPPLGSPIVLTSGPRAPPKKPKSHTAQNAKITKPHPHPPPRRNLKRRRSLNDDAVRGQEKEPEPETLPPPSRPTTPKRQRQRTYPPTLPLGLDRHDFDALPPTTPQTPPATTDMTEWSLGDDSALVALILHKLRLRPRDWDDCARALGKEKDSIGKRWAHLLGDGEVGLRRGAGARRRGDVQAVTFGPLLPVVERE